MWQRGLRRVLVLALATSYLFAALAQSAAAGMIGTQTAIAVQERAQRIASIHSGLARDDIRAQMIQMGVDPKQAQERVAALTDEELALLDGELDRLPAGSGVLEVIGIVFLVLLILELTGVTDIFKKV
jgi:hypothetical protein